MAMPTDAQPDVKAKEKKLTQAQRRKMGKYWCKEVDAANKRLRKFQKTGVKVVQRFLGEDTTKDEQELSFHRSRLNLFHTNIKTLQAFLYGHLPKITVHRTNADSP